MNIPTEKLLDQFRAKHILVIGDVMLDEYLWGAVNRLSPVKIEDLSNINNNQDD
tara:strand:- start:143 stop:304 length:162 start_codon:yes stop_codon:yes gene_type:complete